MMLYAEVKRPMSASRSSCIKPGCSSLEGKNIRGPDVSLLACATTIHSRKGCNSVVIFDYMPVSEIHRRKI